MNTLMVVTVVLAWPHPCTASNGETAVPSLEAPDQCSDLEGGWFGGIVDGDGNLGSNSKSVRVPSTHF